jgi:anthranilate synthase component 1
LVKRLEKPLASLPYRPGPGIDEKQSVTSNMTRGQHAAAVGKAKEHIVAGDIIQIVLSQRFQRPTAAHPVDV